MENIHKDAMMILLFSSLSRLNKKSPILSDLRPRKRVLLIRFLCLKEHGLRQFLLRNLQKALVVFSWHGNVTVIIPGDKAFVANRPQKRPRFEPVRDVVFYTNPMNLN